MKVVVSKSDKDQNMTLLVARKGKIFGVCLPKLWA